MNIKKISNDHFLKNYGSLLNMGDPIFMDKYWGDGNQVKYSVGYGNDPSQSFVKIDIDRNFLSPENIQRYEIIKYHIDSFGLRHFDPNFMGTKITDISSEEFEYYLMGDTNIQSMNLIDSDMDFCKYLITPNFTQAKSGSCEITVENYQYLRSGYSSRKEGELSVLSRWFEFPVEMPPAKYLQIVLYSKEQLIKESEIRNESIDPNLTDWNIIAILGQNSGTIEPMSPITMMRNSLGIEEGGNGHKLDKDQYKKSVDFWSKMATVK